MGWTKRQLVMGAFEEIGLGQYAYDLQPEDLQTALRRLDVLIASWGGDGVRLGYPLPSSPGQSGLDDDSGLPDWATRAALLSLAAELAPGYGKTLSPRTEKNLNSATDAMQRKLAEFPAPMQYPSTLPRGAGNRAGGRQGNYMPPPEDPQTTGSDGILFGT